MRARRFHRLNAHIPSFLRPIAAAFGRGFGSLLARVVAPRRPRHRLLKLGFGLIGLALLALLLVLGVVVGSAMLALALVMRSLRRRQPQPIDPQAVVAEYRVLRKPQLGAPVR